MAHKHRHIVSNYCHYKDLELFGIVMYMNPYMDLDQVVTCDSKEYIFIDADDNIVEVDDLTQVQWFAEETA